MKAKTSSRGRLTVNNPMDDTHETHKQLKQEGGATEALADVLTENLKRLSDQSLQVNENLLSFREEVLDEFTGIHGEIKDIHHNAASNFQKLDAKIDDNFQKLDAKIDSNYQSLDAKIDSNYQSLDAKAEARHAQTLVSSMRWNLGMFIGTVTMFIGLAGLIITLV